MPSKAGVLLPHTGKSSQKTKETMHPDVSGEPVLDPETNIEKEFIFRSVQFEQSLWHTSPGALKLNVQLSDRSLEVSSDTMTKRDRRAQESDSDIRLKKVSALFLFICLFYCLSSFSQQQLRLDQTASTLQ